MPAIAAPPLSVPASSPPVVTGWPAVTGLPGPEGASSRLALVLAGPVARQFLSYDPAAGTAVEVVGDLATATRIAVLVPGVGTELSDFDRGLGGVARRAPAVQARALLRALREADPAARVAVVAWLGYRPPAGLDLDAIEDGRARRGAAALTAFVRGLPAGAQVTLIGHSYGSTVVGLAARDLPLVRDLVALGSPGMDVWRAGQLGGARVWSALAPNDWIHRVPEFKLGRLGLGRQPSSPGFGADPLPTAGVDGHDGYLSPGGATLPAVAAVVLGVPVGQSGPLPGRVTP
jgi:pimeloyl-ACP methyl ester carboxylesterase